MASAPSPFASSKETTNYARLCRLLVDVGSKALRDTFDKLHPPSTLHGVLLSHKPTLQPLYTGCIGKKKVKKVLNPTQWGKLYPVHSPVTSLSFDITLLTVLLRNICGFSPPTKGWDSLPPPTDTSTADDIARVKYYRNTVYGHANQASVGDATFNTYWHEIREVLVRLGGASFRGYIDNLEHDTMDPDMEEHFRELIKQWKKDDDSIKEKLEEMEESIRDKLEQMKSEMENNIRGEMKDLKERLETLAASLEENKDEENIRDKLQQMSTEMKNNIRSEMKEIKEKLETLAASLEENKNEENIRVKLQQMNSEMKNNIRSEMKDMKERLETLTASLEEIKDEERYREDLNKMRSEISDKLDALTVSVQQTKDEESIRDKLEQMKSEMENNIRGEIKDMKERLETLAASLEENKDEGNLTDKLQQMSIEMKNNIRGEMKDIKERLETLTASLEENKDEERYRDDLKQMRSEIENISDKQAFSQAAVQPSKGRPLFRNGRFSTACFGRQFTDFCA